MAERDPSDQKPPNPGLDVADIREPRAQPWIWAVYVALFGVSVPWYLPADGPLRLWFGLPHWVVISVATSLGVALFTVFVVTRYWSVPPAEADRSPPTGDHA